MRSRASLLVLAIAAPVIADAPGIVVAPVHTEFAHGSIAQAEYKKPNLKPVASLAPCVPSSRPGRITTRYAQGNGVGYRRSYTTLEGFFSPLGILRSSWMPFFEARGHVFNDGRPAANAGMGLRYLGKHVYGLSSYYDYRKTRHKHYQQIGVGLETLGNWWGVHLNGYIPLGSRKSNTYGRHTQINVTTQATPSGLLEEIRVFRRKKVEFDFYGVDASAGFFLGRNNQLTFETGFGPYFFWGKYSRKVIGGRASITGRWRDWFSVGVASSYDSRFHARVQGQVAVNFYFGPKQRASDKNSNPLCGYSDYLNRNLTFGPDRFEIIPVDQKTLRSQRLVFSGPSPFSLFDPRTIAGLLLWLDGNDPLGSGIQPANGSRIAAWSDKSGSGNNAVQGNPVQQPFFLTGIQNGLAIVQTDGNASQIGITVPSITMGSNISVFLAANISGLAMELSTDAGALDGWFMDTTNNTHLMNSGNFVDAGAGVWNTGTFQLADFVYDGSTLNLYVKAFGSPQSIFTGINAIPNAPTTTDLFIGGRDVIYSFGGLNNLGEILIYNTPLSDAQRVSVESYLFQKWGL